MNQNYLYELPFEEKIKLIKQNKYLNIFINDSNSLIRCYVAHQNYKLNYLINDIFAIVRQAVAQQGYGLDILINDEDIGVRNSVIEYCKKYPQKQECKNLLQLYKL